MGYFLPLRFIKVGPSCAICATRVVAVLGTEVFQAREAIKQERKAKTLINAAGRDKVKSAIFLDNGTVIASTMSPKQIMNQMDKQDLRMNHRPRAYDNVEVYSGKNVDISEEYQDAEMTADASDFSDPEDEFASLKPDFGNE